MRSLSPFLILAALAAACGARTEPSEVTPLDAGSDPVCTSCGACEERFTIDGAFHEPGDLSYDEVPPVGGNHNPYWANWGVHAEPVPDQCFVHNMEHGGVIFLYDCPEGCAAELAQLETFVNENTLTLLTPYPGLPARFALTSWGKRLVSDCFDLAAFTEFYETSVNMAPEQVGAGNPPRECR